MEHTYIVNDIHCGVVIVTIITVVSYGICKLMMSKMTNAIQQGVFMVSYSYLMNSHKDFQCMCNDMAFNSF